MRTAYLAPEDHLDELLGELSGLTKVEEVHDRLVLAAGPAVSAAWAQNIWFDPREFEVESITRAAQTLRSLQRNWALYSVNLHRRAQLIAGQLPRMAAREVEFPAALPTSPMGSWTLLEKDRILAAARCSSPFPNGEIHFKENRDDPPSRAYLKLWEALTLAGSHPRPGERCLDLGSSPGSWTWALQRLGCEVLSVDKAPLADTVASLPGVRSLKRDAFALEPEELGRVDWFFSDVICYPQRLLELVTRWLRAGVCERYVCTIKLQGREPSEGDRSAIRALAAIPGSTVRHAFHNKHELTWTKLSG